jgi:predicted nucleotidyltransferase
MPQGFAAAASKSMACQAVVDNPARRRDAKTGQRIAGHAGEEVHSARVGGGSNGTERRLATMGFMTETAAPAGTPLSGPIGRRVAAHRGELLDVLRRHGVTNPEIFGSTARGDDHEGSDVDFLVDFAPGTSIIDIIGIQQELEGVLGVPVDLIPRSGLKERVRARARRDLLPL